MKCLKCKKEVKKYYIQQEFTTIINGTKFDGDYEFDFDAGYSLLNEWLDNMLTESEKNLKYWVARIVLNN